MPLKEKLIDNADDTLAEGVDELDAAYLQRMKESGVDARLLEQFRDITLQMSEAHTGEKEK